MGLLARELPWGFPQREVEPSEEEPVTRGKLAAYAAQPGIDGCGQTRYTYGCSRSSTASTLWSWTAFSPHLGEVARAFWCGEPSCAGLPHGGPGRLDTAISHLRQVRRHGVKLVRAWGNREQNRTARGLCLVCVGRR